MNLSNENIYVKPVTNSEDSELILHYMKGSNIFFDKTSRFNSSVVSCLIHKENIPIGFLNLVDEQLSDFLFLDVLIDEKYRGRGYAAMAYENLMSRFNTKKFIIAETKEDNISANKSLQKNSIFLYSCKGLNYYLMDKNRLSELQNSPMYSQLIEHFHREQISAYQYSLNLRNM